MQRPRLKAAAFALAAVVALATPAFAQDYTATTTSNKYLSPPGSATTLTFGNPDDGATTVDLPFAFPYFGKSFTTASVCTNGFIEFGGGTSNSLGNGTLPRSGSPDGIIAVMWDDLNSRTAGSIKTFTTGTAPDRKFVVSYEGVQRFGGTVTMTLQAQLHETSGRIIFAFGPETNWDTGLTYTSGIDALAPDTRFVYHPNKSGSSNSGKPSDAQFDPTVTVYEGRVLIDAVVSDASGFGNSVIEDVVPEGLDVELRSGGETLSTTQIDENGDFTIRAVALASADSGEIALVARSPAVEVSASASTSAIGPPLSETIAEELSFASGLDIGTKTIDDSNDANGTARAPIQIALEATKIYNWVTERTDDEIPQILVFYQSSQGQGIGTRYARSSDPETPSSIRIGGAGSGNEDAFDAAVVSRVYARHVLTHINAITSSSYTSDIDSSTDATNAFADAFGHYLFALANDATETFDGTSSTDTTAFDMETPDLTSARAPQVAGWSAAALFDLIDADNEEHDLIDGTANTDNERPFVVVDALTEAATPTEFLDEWVDQGLAGPELVTNFIHHGLLPDDASEPNDSADLAFDLGQAGVRSSGNTLNQFNEDWYEVLVPAPTDAFLVEVAFNRFAIDADVILEVRSTAGDILATGSPDGDNGPYRAITGARGPGPLHIRIAHNGGDTVTDYTVQAYSRIVLSTQGVPEWTVRRTINQAIQIEGGIPPFTLAVKPPSQLPRGMILDETNGRLIGSPLDVGTETFTITATDSGDPAHNGSITQEFTINDLLSFTAPDVTGVALNRPTSVNLGRQGGTDPIAVENFQGTLPNGLSISEDFEISGTATEPGGGDISFDATDAAGSQALMMTRLVVCSPIEKKKEALPFAEGRGASGYYFDALGGGTINLSVKTAKKRAKRIYDVQVLAPDGTIVTGGKVKVKNGLIIMKKVPTPVTGRYFVTFASDAGDATELLGTLKTLLPKKGAGFIERLDLGSQYRIEFSALTGAKLTFKGKMSDKAMELQVVFVITPSGGVIPFDNVVTKNKKGKVTITIADLPEDGTYQLFVQAAKVDLGSLKYNFKLKQPRGGVFSIDD